MVDSLSAEQMSPDERSALENAKQRCAAFKNKNKSIIDVNFLDKNAG